MVHRLNFPGIKVEWQHWQPLPSRPSAHVLCARRLSDSTDIKPVGIPAGSYSWVIRCLAGGMKSNRFLDQVETAWVDGEDRRDDAVEHFSRPRPMIEVCPIVPPAGVVKKGEKANHSQIGTTAFSDVEPKSINPMPVAWPVDGMRSALENGHYVFTNTSKPSLWRVFSHSQVF